MSFLFFQKKYFSFSQFRDGVPENMLMRGAILDSSLNIGVIARLELPASCCFFLEDQISGVMKCIFSIHKKLSNTFLGLIYRFASFFCLMIKIGHSWIVNGGGSKTTGGIDKKSTYK
jgi:hypothetical protein